MHIGVPGAGPRRGARGAAPANAERLLDDALLSLGHVAEGVPTAPVVLARARQLGVEMPITAAVVYVLEGRATPRHALGALMARSSRAEAAW